MASSRRLTSLESLIKSSELTGSPLMMAVHHLALDRERGGLLHHRRLDFSQNAADLRREKIDQIAISAAEIARSADANQRALAVRDRAAPLFLMTRYLL